MPVFELHLSGGIIRQIAADHMREDLQAKRIYFYETSDEAKNDTWFDLRYVRGIQRLDSEIPDHVRKEVFADLLKDIRARPQRLPSENGDLMDIGGDPQSL
jgi:hypothetical protein